MRAILRLLRRVWLPFAFLALGGAWAHEPYLQLAALPDGQVSVEAGFSDGADISGMKLAVRDRATGALLSDHVLPADGRLKLPIPSVAYRVIFDGGPGHKVNKPGPVAVSQPVPAGTKVATPAPTIKEPPAGVSTGNPLSTKAIPDTRVILVVALIFLLAVVSFSLGYSAASRQGPRP